MELRKNFILGLGHQKCGTSWLYKYLCQSPKFAEGYDKEFHIWDRKDIPFLSGNRTNRPLFTFLPSTSALRYKMENQSDFYFDYFNGLMGRRKTITADITPSYSGLEAGRLEEIKNKFLTRDIETKVVILVREPLSRIKSAVRFNLDRKNYSEGIRLFETDFVSALSQYYKTEHCSIRTRYQNIINEAFKVFEPKNIYVGFYEQMFKEEEILKISDFLQIDAKLEFGKVRINKTKNSVSETELDQRIKDYYSDTYEFFYDKFPVTRSIWG